MSAGVCATLAIPGNLYAANQNILDQVVFDSDTYSNNSPKVILVFLYGGASELAGNFTNINEIEEHSFTSYADYFGEDNITPTEHGFWGYAGGDIMEELLPNESFNFSVLRTCYSQIREEEGNRAHGICTSQNQRGSFTADTSGVFTNLAKILQKNGVIDSDSKLPVLSMEGNSGFFAKGDLYVPAYLRPMDIDADLDENPYNRNDDNYQSFSRQMDELAQSLNPPGKIKTAFEKRQEMSDFIVRIQKNQTPAGAFGYDENNPFANRLKTAIDVMLQNEDTMIVSTGSGGLGGWDDHSSGINYRNRMISLMNALDSAAKHLAEQDKDGNISIIVMSEFGRGVNLNSSQGWDHGNLQNIYVLGGSKYFEKLGIWGQTRLDSTGSANRLYLKPVGSEWFEPFAVASTIYSIFGVKNPEILTDNTAPIFPLLKG